MATSKRWIRSGTPSRGLSRTGLFLPTPKSPHGVDVDPMGEYIVASGKLSADLTVHLQEDADGDREPGLETTISGIPCSSMRKWSPVWSRNPVLGHCIPNSTEKEMPIPPSLSPQSGEVERWYLGSIGPSANLHSVGHLMIPGGDSKKPQGKYLVALNKITKDRYLPTGPELTQSAQLYDISGDKMKMLLDFPTV